jgi:hypothetical protein
MKRYRITLYETVAHTVDIDARSQREADTAASIYEFAANRGRIDHVVPHVTEQRSISWKAAAVAVERIENSDAKTPTSIEGADGP